MALVLIPPSFFDAQKEALKKRGLMGSGMVLVGQMLTNLLSSAGRFMATGLGVGLSISLMF